MPQRKAPSLSLKSDGPARGDLEDFSGVEQSLIASSLGRRLPQGDGPLSWGVGAEGVIFLI